MNKLADQPYIEDISVFFWGHLDICITKAEKKLFYDAEESLKRLKVLLNYLLHLLSFGFITITTVNFTPLSGLTELSSFTSEDAQAQCICPSADNSVYICKYSYCIDKWRSQKVCVVSICCGTRRWDKTNLSTAWIFEQHKESLITHHSSSSI